MIEDIIIDGINITPDLLKEFETGWHFDALQAKLRQQRAAEERQAIGIVAGDSAAGLLQYQIDPFWYHYWGKRESYELFSDAREMERFARDTPEIRVEQKKRTIVNGADFTEGNKENKGRTVLLDQFGRAVTAA